MIASRDIAALDPWLADARQRGLPMFAAPANGIIADLAAVEAALSTRWSIGPVGGQIHRVASRRAF